MRIFISWSGQASKRHALAFRSWIELVFQGVQPFMSEVDIDAGQSWLNVIQDKLSSSDFGVVFLTRNNIKSSWIHYEVGAIVKGAGKARMVPLLCNIDLVDLSKRPLSYLQAKSIERDGIFFLCKSINNSLEDARIKDGILEETFNTWWPKLEAEFKGAGETAERRPSEVDPVRMALDNLTDRVTQLVSKNEEFIGLHSSMIRILLRKELEKNHLNFNALSKNWHEFSSIRKTGNALRDAMLDFEGGERKEDSGEE